ncbi:hypothetical protein F7725_008676 [Dissostichus mawsoni]|uniref:Cysteine sulfinic acid decarboxylase n=1 Tax=Dissostichus mawsoni TaxID=36200 RepID=A0A7J5Y8P0_DISMA|nr:hypothetical protein F7725_008676 [Dissostichus mawsoni]
MEKVELRCDWPTGCGAPRRKRRRRGKRKRRGMTEQRQLLTLLLWWRKNVEQEGEEAIVATSRAKQRGRDSPTWKVWKWQTCFHSHDPAELPDMNDPLIDHSEGQLFLNEAFKIIIEEVLCKGTDVKQKVCEWKEPEDLALLLDLELRAAGEPQQRLLQRVKDVAKYSIKTSHPRFFNQLFAGVDYHALAGRFLSEALNTNLYTYEVAPVFVLLETEVLRSLRQLVGWTEGDGIFCPGGSTSNMFAMNLARYRLFPEVKSQGLWAVPRLTIFTSAESHYSVKKGAAYLGIGTDNIIVVKVDEGGRIIPEDLEEKIELTQSQGAVPLLVSCTSGTTVRGAFDPLDRIADVCEKHTTSGCIGPERDRFKSVDKLLLSLLKVNYMLHVFCCVFQAAWGGSVLFSEQHRHLMKGVARANSVAWNPHKLLMAGLQCSALLLQDTTNLLKKCHSANATYLFQQDKCYDVNLDVGDKTVQCGRKDDCLKLWLMWKAVGSIGLAERVDKAFNLVAPVIKERMIKQGTMMVGYQPLGDKVNFFRMIVLSTLVSKEDMDFFLDEIERLGNDL